MGAKRLKFDPVYLRHSIEYFQTAFTKVGPLWAPQNPPTLPELRVPLWGTGAPKQKITFAPVSLQKFRCALLKGFVDRVAQPEYILRFKKKIYSQVF